jgi:hypothetical protein
MNNIILILLGWLYLIIWVWIILNKELYKKLYEKVINSWYWLLVIWILAYLIWAGIILLNYNNPNLSYKIIYFIIWFLALLKWWMFMISPNCMIKLTNFFLKRINLLWYFVIFTWILLIGLWVYLKLLY